MNDETVMHEIYGEPVEETLLLLHQRGGLGRWVEVAVRAELEGVAPRLGVSTRQVGRPQDHRPGADDVGPDRHVGHRLAWCERSGRVHP